MASAWAACLLHAAWHGCWHRTTDSLLCEPLQATAFIHSDAPMHQAASYMWASAVLVPRPVCIAIHVVTSKPVCSLTCSQSMSMFMDADTEGIMSPALILQVGWQVGPCCVTKDGRCTQCVCCSAWHAPTTKGAIPAASIVPV